MGEYKALSIVYSLQLFIQYSPVNEFRYIPCLKQSQWSGRGLVSCLQSSQTFHGLHLLGPSDRHRNRIASDTSQRGVCRVLVFLPWCHRPDWALGLYQLQTPLWKRLEALMLELRNLLSPFVCVNWLNTQSICANSTRIPISRLEWTLETLREL